MHFIGLILQNLHHFSDENVMNAISQHWYFKAPLFHYKTLFMTPLLALQSHYLTGRLRLKSSSKMIDLDTPVSLKHPWTCLERFYCRFLLCSEM